MFEMDTKCVHIYFGRDKHSTMILAPLIILTTLTTIAINTPPQARVKISQRNCLYHSNSNSDSINGLVKISAKSSACGHKGVAITPLSTFTLTR